MSKPTNSKLIVDTNTDGVVYGSPCTLERVVVSGVSNLGTVTVHDAATEAEANNGNRVAIIGTDSRMGYEFGLTMRKGIVAVASAGATPAVTVVWS